MLVPLSWLRDFSPFEARAGDAASVAALGEVMDDLGMVVEGIEPTGEGLGDVVVSKVLEVGAIAGADRIRRVLVDAGGPEPVQIVCGAWNFGEGDVVPLAPVGAVLPGGFSIGRRKMRGVTSNGMLCSGRELRLSDDGEGLLVLSGAPAAADPGTPLTEALGIEADVVYDLAIETNRPDALCIAGVARDLAGRLKLPFGLPEPPAPADLATVAAQGAGPGVPGTGAAVATAAMATASVVAEDLCPRLTAQVLDVSSVPPTPAWMARRLTLAGMRPIGPVVDATNYVMLELGQPTHPYDLDRLAGHGLLVRRAEPGERLVTLDGVERALGLDPRTGDPVDDCLICDAEGGAVGIGGIMGGRSSEIGPGTARVLLEAAWFLPMAVARTSRRLALRTEASVRFERGCDPEGIERSVARVCQLLAGAGAPGAGGSWASASPGALAWEGILPGLVRIGRAPERPRVRLRTARVNALLGTDLSAEAVSGYLAPLGFQVSPASGGDPEVVVPSWRPDCTREIDLVEEVARHHGYSAIPRTRPSSPRVGRLTPYQRGRRLVRSVLAGLGASEAWTSSMVAPEDHERAGLGGVGAVEVENPLAREESVLRLGLLPGLVKAVAANAAHRDPEVALFEVGRVFAPPREGEERAHEVERVGLVLARAGDDAAGAVLAWRALADALHLDGSRIDLVAGAAPGMHPTRSARLVSGGAEFGSVGEVDPGVLESFGLEGRRAGWLDLDLGALLGAPHLPEEARPVSRFPSAEFDLAFVVDDAVQASAVAATLREAAGALVEELGLFDVYRGPQLGPGRRSLAYRLRLAAPDRTLTEADLAAVRAACVEAVRAAHGGELRA